MSPALGATLHFSMASDYPEVPHFHVNLRLPVGLVPSRISHITLRHQEDIQLLPNVIFQFSQLSLPAHVFRPREIPLCEGRKGSNTVRALPTWHQTFQQHL